MKEPSLLLIDDMAIHEEYLKMLNLDQEGWVVKTATDLTIDGATKKAIREINANDGFTFLLLDIKWPADRFGGVKILNRLSKRYNQCLPIRRVIIMSRESIGHIPELVELAQVLKMKEELHRLQLTTDYERKQLKKALLKAWNEIKEHKQQAGQ